MFAIFSALLFNSPHEAFSCCVHDSFKGVTISGFPSAFISAASAQPRRTGRYPTSGGLKDIQWRSHKRFS